MDTIQAMIRPGGDHDGPALAELIASIFAEYAGCLFVDSEFPELEQVSRHFTERGGAIWVACDAEGRVVGSLAIAPRGPPDIAAFELFKVYVAPALRGGDLAGALLAKGVAFAVARDARQLCLWTDTRFTRAHAFYEKRGFVRTGGERALEDASNTREFEYRLALSA